MRWQRAAQTVILLFVIGFVVVLARTLGTRRAEPEPRPVPVREQPGSTMENPGGCEHLEVAGGKRLFSIECGKHFAFPDGRQKFTDGIKLTIPREGREYQVTANEAEVVLKADDIDTALFKGDVQFTSDGGLSMRSAEATYSDRDGIVRVPGAVEFTRGSLRGSGVGATYDRNRDTLWIMENAKLDVAADPAKGQGAITGSAGAMGLARAEHFLRLERDARLSGDGRTLEGDVIVIRLTEDDERVRLMELRGNSRITGGASGPQAMSARDIDLTYAEDGRTLQHARLVENAVLQLAPGDGAAGKRISGSTIDLTLGPDGNTVTNLAAQQRVEVDLPAEGDVPAKQIRAAALSAHGAPGAGLQQATFTGGVDYRETRAARPKVAAVSRTARSDTLVLDTAPGLGAIERTEFRGNFSFVEQPDLKAEAPQAIYHVDRDRLELRPGDQLPGRPPHVSDGRISVAARTIDFTLSTRELDAETRVRSTMAPRPRDSRSKDGPRLPSMMDDDEPVSVTANRLRYLGETSAATYTGNAVLWQKDTQIKADTIVVDDRAGNLTATGTATTQFFIDETDRQTGKPRRVETRGSAETFTYNEERRLATYTGKARLIGAQGDVTGDTIQLYMKPDANELERAEAYGTTEPVVVREALRTAKGSRLTYTAATDEYFMVGTPVEIIEEKKGGGCVLALGATATFNRTADSAHVSALPPNEIEQRTIACPPPVRR